MRIQSVLFVALVNTLAVYAFLIPHHVGQFARGNEPSLLTERATNIMDLFKRKGGGGGGHSSGGGSSGGGHTSGGSSSSGSSSGGSSSSGSSGGTRSGGLGSTSSNSGGRTSGGSGSRPLYSGGGTYAGGAAVPYRAGGRSALGFGAAGFLALGAIAFWPGHWTHGVYFYPYAHPYTFYNQSASQNQTKPVECLCQQYGECGCEDNTNSTYINTVIGDGNPSNFNNSVIRVADINGTSTILINGTLDNGTTAAGGTESASGASRRAGGAIERLGWFVIAGAIASSMWLL